MIKRFVKATAAIIGLVTLLTFLPGVEFDERLGKLAAYVLVLNLLFVECPEYIEILKVSRAAREMLAGVVLAFGIVVMLTNLGFIDPEAKDLPPAVIALVFGAIAAPGAIRWILVRFVKVPDSVKEELDE